MRAEHRARYSATWSTPKHVRGWLNPAMRRVEPANNGLAGKPEVALCCSPSCGMTVATEPAMNRATWVSALAGILAAAGCSVTESGPETSETGGCGIPYCSQLPLTGNYCNCFDGDILGVSGERVVCQDGCFAPKEGSGGGAGGSGGSR